MLEASRKEVAATVAGTDWQAYHLPQLKAAIDRAIQEFGSRYGVDLREAQGEFWNHGSDMIDIPLRDGGIMAAIPAIDTTVLSIMQGYGADLVKGVAHDAALRINNELTMGLMGQKSPFEVMQAVGTNLKDPSIFKSIAARAETITRTECGRALEAASQARLEKAAKVVPGLKKRWRHGGSGHPRISHLAAAAGDPIPVDQPYHVNGEALMFPKDPAGSAANTINCSCYSVAHMESWEAAA
jgi:hypothetical protein